MTSPAGHSDLGNLIALQGMRRYYDWKAELVSPFLGPRVLEVGCGTGLMLARIAPREALVGIDRDGACVEYARARLGDAPRLELRELDVADPGFLELSSLDMTTVLFVNALEEIPDDSQAVRRAATVLRPGGRVVLLASALPVLSGRMDREFGQRRYSRNRIREIIEGAGLKLVQNRYVNLLGALAWLWDSRVLGLAAVTAKAYSRRDRFVPLARLLDSLTGAPFGRSLLAVGEKA